MSRSLLADVVDSGWLLAAEVDVVRGEVLERRAAPHCGQDRDDVLLAAIEMLRSSLRPRQLLLFAGRHIHLYERSLTTPHRANIFIAERTSNIGLLLSDLRRLQRGASS